MGIKEWPVSFSDPQSGIGFGRNRDKLIDNSNLFFQIKHAKLALVRRASSVDKNRGRANFSNSTRRVIHVGYACPNTPPQQDISSTITKEAKIRLGEKSSLLPNSLESFGLDNNWLSKSTIEKVIHDSVSKN